MTYTELQQRLDALGQKIGAARARVKQGHDHPKARQLEERYRVLKRKLDEDTADAEAHGRHVSDLEKSVQGWIESFDTDI